MARAKLSSYIKKIENKYIVAREKYAEIEKKLNELEQEHRSTNKSDYSVQGMQKKDAEYLEKKRALIAQLQAVRDDFTKTYEEIKKESDEVFYRKYCYNPADVDDKGLAILEKGNPTEQEIMQLGARYEQQGNNTMMFMCADKLGNSKDLDIKAWAQRAAAMRGERKDHRVLDKFAGVCLSALRDEISLSNNIHDNLHEQAYNEGVTAGDSITVEVGNPWEN